jgi:hypothetical protein
LLAAGFHEAVREQLALMTSRPLATLKGAMAAYK